jgi:hypothetical protein
MTGLLVDFRMFFRGKLDLGQAGSVPQINENNTAVVTPVLYPAHEADLLVHILCTQLRAGMGSFPAVKGIKLQVGASFVHGDAFLKDKG